MEPARANIHAPSTLLADMPAASRAATPAAVHARRAGVPALCEPGVILRALLVVQAVVGAGAAFGSASGSAWLMRSVSAAAVSVPATLAWLLAACGATPLLARLPAGSRVAVAGLAGGLAAWGASLPLGLIGMAVGDGVDGGVPAVAGAGVLLGAAVYHWLQLRLRATLPAATEARLVELQARVRPHFLFNTLNTAIALVQVDPERAEAVLEDLAELFRAALAAADDASTLGDEIRLARLYLAIEGMRFGARLAVEWDVDEAVDAAPVPPLLLQPLVENAVRHGVEPNDAGGRVQIRARVRNGRAWVEVINTVGAAAHPGHGIGLAGARERLRLMHDLGAEFQSGLQDDGRYRVRLAVPL